MKKLLISDYDGTFKTSDAILIKNIDSINNYMNTGNIFGISTGRSYESLYREKEKYRFSFDYLSCHNANSIFDKELRLLYKNCIDSNFTKTLFSYRKYIDYFIPKNAYSIFSDEDILEYVIRFYNLKGRSIFLKYILDSDLYTYYTDGQDKLVIHVFSKEKDKKNICEFISSREGISKSNIYTIGDGDNDLEMIREYNGYAMRKSPENIRTSALGLYDDFYELVNNIDSAKKRTRIKKNE